MLGYILEHQVFTQCLWTGSCLLSGLRLPGALGPNVPIFGPKRGEEAGVEAPDQNTHEQTLGVRIVKG